MAQPTESTEEATGVLRSAPSQAEIRDELQRLILADLLGPAGGEHEEVEERVNERYLVGMLAPQHSTTDPAQSDALSVEGQPQADEGEAEPDAPPNSTLLPSAMGLTGCVDGSVEQLVVAAGWGRYERVERPAEDGGKSRRVWAREPCGGTVTVPLAEGALTPDPVAPDARSPDVQVQGQARKVDGDWVVTLFLVNRQQEPTTNKDAAWVFQAGFEVAAGDGQPVFLRRSLQADGEGEASEEAEQRALAMAYRDEVEFAVGHGVGVETDVDEDDPRQGRRLATAVVPSFEVKPTVQPNEGPLADRFPALQHAVLDMAVLAELDQVELAGALTPLADAYEAWLDAQQQRIGDPDARLEGFEETARQALVHGRRALARIRAGIATLVDTDDSVPAQAFRFANQAMARQRIHTEAATRRQHEHDRSLDEVLAEVDVAGNRSWRPFQLAFFLLNVPAMADPAHPERNEQALVDLLWFPTGGGKTEAYLGLSAYTLGLRRLHGRIDGFDGSDGVGVLMRYTLRLLTSQQFQRATALLCACETIRREASPAGDDRWGSAPFRIGLWVGLRATPNRTEDADRWLKQQRGSGGFARGSGGSPAQFRACPWCGAEVKADRDITVDPDVRRTLTYCGDRTGSCPFTARQATGEGLPVVVVDDEIYRLLPDLVIATVDKFAQLPWRGAVQTLFGQVQGRCERHGFRYPDDEEPDNPHPKHGRLPRARTDLPAGPLRPPDLIIQDELHLITGPLGSMVGLYETAVDELCTWHLDGSRVRPKVIASTATVRRAEHQAHALFWRNLAIFPPQGLDATDSFFAIQREPDPDHPGRRYLGICAHGRRIKAALIRVYVAHLAAAQYLYGWYGAGVDPYMTLVGYFNSLRELGGMRRAVDDDVTSRLRDAHERGLADRRLRPTQELTSRMGSDEIPRILDQLSVGHDPEAAQASTTPVDVVLATNMLSVGVDVPRLGTMIVGGQPKHTAEYIQATSRVGRRAPGLVLTVYNWARPRDLSHYETFGHYHATFYRQVEALSVTPFAPRALDRGLTALLVALVRHARFDWSVEEGAKRVDVTAPEVRAAAEAIRRRAAGVTARNDVADHVRDELEIRCDQWQGHQAVGHRELRYRKPYGGGTAAGLLKAPSTESWDRWTCLTSLRDVEPGIDLLLADGDLGEGLAPAFEPLANDEPDDEEDQA
jgi:hypothetical protein